VPPFVGFSHLWDRNRNRNRQQQVLLGQVAELFDTLSPFPPSRPTLPKDGKRAIFHVQVPWYSIPIPIAISIWNSYPNSKFHQLEISKPVLPRNFVMSARQIVTPRLAKSHLTAILKQGTPFANN
jgi:hypothetical protein